ncbi:hypothetical protein DSM104299_00537 [Baekduia alba]|uniref:hypothetical protein n=1 Tax=Baekduia alba TaxID=2997333 RepID=UPI00233F7D91|nr:hypothetical protein [Baekduia alba]WCB91859.1 hypothetical protein DSM104299_00537 [Baekduia alba]
MNNEFRVGVIGTPHEVVRRTLPALFRLDSSFGARLVAMAGPEARDAKAFLDSGAGRKAAWLTGHAYPDGLNLGDVETHDSPWTMLEHTPLDGVIVAGEDASDAICIVTLRRKCHVLTAADPVIADPIALAKLQKEAAEQGRRFDAGHLSGYRSSLFDSPDVAEALDGVPGVSARWCIAASSKVRAPGAARLLALTTPVAIALRGTTVTLKRIDQVGGTAIRGIWETAAGRTAIIDVEWDWPMPGGDQASLTAYGPRARVALPLAPPGARVAAHPDELTGTLRPKVGPPRWLATRRTFQDCEQVRMQQWVEACQGDRTPTVTTRHALVAAQMAQFLATALNPARTGDA